MERNLSTIIYNKMKTNFLRKQTVSVLLFAFMMVGTLLNAQTLTIKSYTLTAHGGTNMKGHDFTTKVTQMTGTMTVTDNLPQSLTVEIPVRSLNNGNRVMDNKTHDAFDPSKNPTIHFTMTEMNSLQVEDDQLVVTVTGNLSMGGETKKVTLKATGKEVSPGVYTFQGTQPIKMSDFGMKAPTAMMGTLKVKDDVTVNYRVTFEGAVVNFNAKEYTQKN
jgi:polyisoprenoid-binding protein YceI